MDAVGFLSRSYNDEIERNYNAQRLAISLQQKLAITWGKLKVFLIIRFLPCSPFHYKQAFNFVGTWLYFASLARRFFIVPYD